jgi:hypothetical protein
VFNGGKERMRRGALLSLTAITLSGMACDFAPFGVGCEDYGAPGLRISIFDRNEGSPVKDALVWIRSGGEYVDTLYAADGVAWGAFERTGKYTIYVEHPAYRPWKKKDVEVEMEDHCHVRTKRVRAELRSSG